MLQLTKKMPQRGYEPPEAGTNGSSYMADNSKLEPVNRINCGSLTGYKYHQNNNENFCLPCKNANTNYQKAYKQAHKISKPPKNPCGTYAAYKRHIKNKEKPCDACAQAKRDYYYAHKESILASTKKYRSKNPDKVKLYNQKYKELNKEKMNVKALDYYYKNKDFLLTRKAAWRKANLEKVREQGRQYQKANLEKGRNSVRRRRAKRKENGYEFYTEQQVLELYGTNCALCGQPIDLTAPRVGYANNGDMGLHIDHIIPISKGGSDTLNNVQPTHAKCNKSKGAKKF